MALFASKHMLHDYFADTYALAWDLHLLHQKQHTVFRASFCKLFTCWDGTLFALLATVIVAADVSDQNRAFIRQSLCGFIQKA